MLRIDRRLLSHFEWPLLLIVLLLAACGLITVLSATYTAERPLSVYLVRQSTWVGLGLIALVISLSVDYRSLNRHGYTAYAIVLVLLLLVPLAGTSGGGARRWLSLGGVALQPSEFMKIALVVALARHLHRDAGGPRLVLRRLIVPSLLFALPALLILKQPDLGTVISLGLGLFVVLLLAGMPVRLVAVGLIVLAAVLPYAWHHLKPYQQQRILTYFDPEADPLGSGYHIIQSQIAIGSGMVHGKGYLRGTQNKLNFLPEQHTDFIFSVYAEEWGLVGCLFLLGLYALLVLRGVVIASKARDNLGALIAAGLTGVIFCQVAINIGMTTGVLPVVGITLPFLSYGGSSILSLMIAVGLIMNVSMRRYTF
jgi:rod shape determining protein RodA